MVDVTTSIVIDQPVEVVAAYAGDPANAPTWYGDIESVEWATAPAVREGAKATFVARFLGRTLRYTYEIVELRPNARLVMRAVEGPFPMETTYTWESLGPESTAMSLRNRGEPSGFSRFAQPLMARAMRRANTRDLAALKSRLEA